MSAENIGTNGKKDARGADGRWLPGNPGGPGGGTVQRSIEIKALCQRSVTDDEVKRIMRKLVELALSGDVRAAEVVLNRICGKPSEVVIEGDIINHHTMLVNTTAEAMKELEAKRKFAGDPMRGRKRLSNRNGK